MSQSQNTDCELRISETDPRTQHHTHIKHDGLDMNQPTPHGNIHYIQMGNTLLEGVCIRLT